MAFYILLVIRLKSHCMMTTFYFLDDEMYKQASSGCMRCAGLPWHGLLIAAARHSHPATLEAG